MMTMTFTAIVRCEDCGTEGLIVMRDHPDDLADRVVGWASFHECPSDPEGDYGDEMYDARKDEKAGIE